MKGKILHITAESVVIRADDDQKFEVANSEFKSQVNPNIGDEVDFDITEGAAHSVYVLRQSASIDDHIGNAKTAANKFYNQAKGNLNEENLNKAKKLASTVASKAKGSLSNIDLSKATSAVKSVNLASSGNFKAHNKFAVLVLVALFVSMILPMFKMFNETQSYFDLVDGTGLQSTFIVLTLISLLLGLPRIISRFLSIIFLITLCIPLYDGFSFIKDMGSLFGPRSNLTQVVLQNMQLGLPLLFITGLLFAILQMLPGYKTNEKFLADDNNQ